MRSRLLLACGSLIGVIVHADAVAQNYLLKPVRIIVPTPAGGNPDFIARPVAQKMSESLKQAFIIDNRPGAAGTIGVELAVRAAPDGYAILARWRSAHPGASRSHRRSRRSPTQDSVTLLPARGSDCSLWPTRRATSS